MKTKGEIRGTTIELETATNLPDGQAVEVEIRLLTARPVTAGIIGDVETDAMKAAEELRGLIAKQVGGNLDCSSRYVREDRER